MIDAGTPKERIDQILAPFAQWIPFDLQSAIVQSALEAARKKGMSPQESNEFSAKLNAVLKEPSIAVLDRAEKMIHEAGLSSPEVETDINRYRTFLIKNEVSPLLGNR